MSNKAENIDGLSQISHRYDVFIFDLWGVVHDGITPFQHSVDAMNNQRIPDDATKILPMHHCDSINPLV